MVGRSFTDTASFYSSVRAGQRCELSLCTKDIGILTVTTVMSRDDSSLSQRRTFGAFAPLFLKL